MFKYSIFIIKYLFLIIECKEVVLFERVDITILVKNFEYLKLPMDGWVNGYTVYV